MKVKSNPYMIYIHTVTVRQMLTSCHRHDRGCPTGHYPTKGYPIGGRLADYPGILKEVIPQETLPQEAVLSHRSLYHRRLSHT